jgi:hypothetical protein
MKESRKEFIKKAHSAASNEWKKNFEKEFPKLFKEDALEVGKWVKTVDGAMFCIQKKEVNMFYGYGFRLFNIWDESYYSDKGLCTLATDKEVEEALIKEAERRGFKKGVKFIRLSNGVVLTVDGLPYFTHGRLSVLSPKTEWSSVYKGGCSNPFIFDNGKWATIVETITKEQAEKELGKTILN